MLLDFEIEATKEDTLKGVLTQNKNTARLQTINKKEDNPFMHKLLTYLYEKHHIKALINTSFNIQGQPIVQTDQDAIITAEKIGNLTISPEKAYRRADQITSADISRDGQKVLIKTYYNVIFIEKSKKTPLSSILSSKQVNLDYIREIGGEALCWRWDQSGYYTISEESKNRPAHLYYYPF